MSNEEERTDHLPAYFTVTPASVRYDPNLTDFQIKLYGEIICHTNLTGYCWGSNEYFASFYNKIRAGEKKSLSKFTISRAISKLSEHGHIHITYAICSLCKQKERRIYPDIGVLMKSARGIDEKRKGYCVFCQGGIDEKRKGGIDEKRNVNNLIRNNINEYIMSSKNLTTDKPTNFKAYEDMEPQERIGFDSNPISNKDKRSLHMGALCVLDFLNYKTGSAFRTIDTNLKLITSILKSGVPVADMRMVITSKCTEWLDDPTMAHYLRPATLFGKNKFEQYYGEYLGKIKQVKKESYYYG